jgi:hypothetical protein
MEQAKPRKPVQPNRLNVNHRKAAARSRLTNGATLPARNSNRCIDGRSSWCRRLRDLLDSFSSDLGGWDRISTAEGALLRRCAVLITELERRELAFAQDAAIDDASLSVYLTASNSLGRLLQAIGLERRPRDVTPTLAEYLDARARQLEQEDERAESVP